MRLVFTILLLLIIIFLAALLVTAYVITRIISWLVANPLGGIVLLVITVILASVLIREEMKENETDWMSSFYVSRAHRIDRNVLANFKDFEVTAFSFCR